MYQPTTSVASVAHSFYHPEPLSLHSVPLLSKQLCWALLCSSLVFSAVAMLITEIDQSIGAQLQPNIKLPCPRSKTSEIPKLNKFKDKSNHDKSHLANNSEMPMVFVINHLIGPSDSSLHFCQITPPWPSTSKPPALRMQMWAQKMNIGGGTLCQLLLVHDIWDDNSLKLPGG